MPDCNGWAADKQLCASRQNADQLRCESAVILAPELRSGLATLTSVSDHGDDLTNTQEQQCCTGSWISTLKSS